MTDQREKLEADFTSQRIYELELEPIKGNFDAAHLMAVNRHIFQDLPGAGFDDVTPGEFRKEVAEGKDWMKNRGLATIEGSFYVAYSRMDETAKKRLDGVLEGAKPDALRDLKPDEFTKKFAAIYAELDYIHPFSDGNSRTLRTFTKQLANEAGYDVDWERFNRSPTGRDLLSIARDLSVNVLAKPAIQQEQTMRKIVHALDRLEQNRALPDLLRDAIKPSRAVAFERMKEPIALAAHPELKEAYRTLHAASAYFESKQPNSPQAREEGLDTVLRHIQARLDAGDTKDFSAGREAKGPAPKSAPGLNERAKSERDLGR